MKLLAALLTAVVVLIGAPPRAAADSFVLEPPSLLHLDFEGHEFWFTGEGFSVRQHPMTPGLSFTGGWAPTCDPCRAGDVYDPSFRTAGEVFLGNGPATLGGASYSDAALYGTLSFSATPVLFPALSVDTYLLVTPFTFNGSLRGVVAGQQVFAADFTGAGDARRSFHVDLGSGLAWGGENTQMYWFAAQADPAPVPEPATLLLVGTGTVLAAVRKRRRLRALS